MVGRYWALSCPFLMTIALLSFQVYYTRRVQRSAMASVKKKKSFDRTTFVMKRLSVINL